jgi:hypothetical protein
VNFGGKRNKHENDYRAIAREFLEELLFTTPVSIDPMIIDDFVYLFLETKKIHYDPNYPYEWRFVICSYSDLDDMLTYINDRLKYIYKQPDTHGTWKMISLEKRAYTYYSVPKNVSELLTTKRNEFQTKMSPIQRKRLLTSKEILDQDNLFAEIGRIKEFDFIHVLQYPDWYELDPNQTDWDPTTLHLDPDLIVDLKYIYSYARKHRTIFEKTNYRYLTEES